MFIKYHFVVNVFESIYNFFKVLFLSQLKNGDEMAMQVSDNVGNFLSTYCY